MSQSFNSDAIQATFSVLFKDSSPAVPHFEVKTIAEIDPEYLWEQGIRGVIFDKDNTITAPYINEIYPDLIPVVAKFKELFGDNMKILSNSAGTNDDTDYRDALEIEEKLDISVIRHKRKKPMGTESIGDHFSCDVSSIMMIGDRLLTDTLFGNLAGMITVHTGILTTKGDNKPAMLARIWENGLLRKWRRKNVQPPKHLLAGISLKRD